MAIPATGTEWKLGGYADVDSKLFVRGGLVAAAIRDYRGAETNMSPSGFSPFALDGTPRDDLFAIKKVAGVWTITATANEGFWNVGAFGEKNGPDRRPNTKNDDFMILQSNWPFDSDLISEGETIRFTGVERLKPMLQRLRNNLPLTDENGDIIVEDVGQAGYGLGKPVEAELVERQLLLLRKRSKAGRSIYTCEGFPLVKLTDIGASKKDKQNADAAELTFTVLPDPYFVDVDGSPLIHYEWVAGDGWTSMGEGLTTDWTVTLGAQSTGTFTLTWGGNTTGTIVYNAANSVVKTALVALDDGFVAADWTVAGSAGGPYTVTTPIPGSVLTGSGALLTTPGNFAIAAVP